MSDIEHLDLQMTVMHVDSIQKNKKNGQGNNSYMSTGSAQQPQEISKADEEEYK